MKSQQLQGPVPNFKNLDVTAPKKLDPRCGIRASKNYEGKFGTQQIPKAAKF